MISHVATVAAEPRAPAFAPHCLHPAGTQSEIEGGLLGRKKWTTFLCTRRPNQFVVHECLPCSNHRIPEVSIVWLELTCFRGLKEARFWMGAKIEPLASDRGIAQPFSLSRGGVRNDLYPPHARARAVRTSRCACERTLDSRVRQPGSMTELLSSASAISRWLAP